jgi:glycosyltransferase involved in cell wall biosynthesis
VSSIDRGRQPSGDAASPRIVVTTVMSPTGVTGLQTHVQEVRCYFERAKRSVTVVTPMSRTPVIVAPLFLVGRVINQLNRAAGVAFYRWSHRRFLTRALRRELRRNKDSVVYAQCPLSARAALDARSDAGQRVVMAIHYDGSQAAEWSDRGVIAQNGPVSDSILRLERSTIPKLDGLVFVSESARRALTTFVPESEHTEFVILPNFTNPGQEAPSPLAEPADLITIGSLLEWKNHQYLLEVLAAANQLGRRYTLDVIGGGATWKALHKLRADLGLERQVRLHGQLSQARSALGVQRAYVHAGIREAFPFALVEAMAAGLPVIAGAIGGIPEMIDEGVEGRLWPLDDARAAARILVEVMENEPRRATMGAAARTRYERRYAASIVGPRLERALVHGSTDTEVVLPSDEHKVARKY